jgi:hypothetical protein
MNATPRNLDPKFKDATAPDTNEKESGEDTLKRLQSTEIPKDPTEGNIVFHQQIVDSAGNTITKTHGPMPVSEWAAYSEKNGL